MLTEIALALLSLLAPVIDSLSICLYVVASDIFFTRSTGYMCCFSFGVGIGVLSELHAVWTYIALRNGSRVLLDAIYVIATLVLFMKSWRVRVSLVQVCNSEGAYKDTGRVSLVCLCSSLH